MDKCIKFDTVINHFNRYQVGLTLNNLSHHNAIYSQAASIRFIPHTHTKENTRCWFVFGESNLHKWSNIFK